MKNLYMTFILTAFMCSHASITEIVYEAKEDDIMESRTRPLISGRKLENGQCAITLGFKESHAYLVFENKEQDQISLNGVHFIQRRTSTSCSYAARVDLEPAPEVLKKFHRAQRVVNKRNPFSINADPMRTVDDVDPIYTKFSTFIIDGEKIANLSGFLKSVIERPTLSFSRIGDVFSRTTHNCCSFIPLCLKQVGIDISIPGIWARSPENLKHYTKKYSDRNPGTVSIL